MRRVCLYVAAFVAIGATERLFDHLTEKHRHSIECRAHKFAHDLQEGLSPLRPGVFLEEFREELDRSPDGNWVGRARRAAFRVVARNWDKSWAYRAVVLLALGLVAVTMLASSGKRGDWAGFLAFWLAPFAMPLLLWAAAVALSAAVPALAAAAVSIVFLALCGVAGAFASGVHELFDHARKSAEHRWAAARHPPQS